MEKYLKAYMDWLEIEYPKTHMLERLIYLISSQDKEILKLKEDAAKLTPFAVEARYPEFEIPGQKEAIEAVEIARRIKDYILSRLLPEIEKK